MLAIEGAVENKGSEARREPLLRVTCGPIRGSVNALTSDEAGLLTKGEKLHAAAVVNKKQELKA